ncbi:2OG-Fe(II) oxygenase [Allofrancisella frigidaquae]|uniref:2OG-Fe(II) oxygenase n=1 Tax=Allofrancisella frigidaquae TaxID=1085644 RepID=A0A6M3HUI4_9GAMM|nr:2OG-Fe(II) oxygenase [Allofrancisella frigidaquae]QIV94859.1 2OG-Fe(II) oxygenase [Allofrancisella frigidaquae]
MLEHIYGNTVFNFDKFEEYVKKNKAAYQNKNPFSYDSISNLFSDEALNNVINSFPSIKDKRFWDIRNDEGIQVKYRTKWQTELDIPPNILLVVQALQSGRFCRLLSEFTGIKGLMPDYWFGGGGLNQIMKGGQLAIHVDGTWNDDIRMYRRVNVIVFLNKNWKEEYGGYLEFWDKDLTYCVDKIPPVFNNMVLFNTSDLTQHGHPHKLQCPENMSRKSLILYYYTSSRPNNEIIHNKVHRAIFTPFEEIIKKNK